MCLPNVKDCLYLVIVLLLDILQFVNVPPMHIFDSILVMTNQSTSLLVSLDARRRYRNRIGNNIAGLYHISRADNDLRLRLRQTYRVFRMDGTIFEVSGIGQRWRKIRV